LWQSWLVAIIDFRGLVLIEVDRVVFAALLSIDFSIGLSDLLPAKVGWFTFVEDSLLKEPAVLVPGAASVCFLGQEWFGLDKFLLAKLAVVPSGSHTLAIAAVLVEQAKISVEHELVLSCNQACVNPCPLILERVITHGELWAPAF